MKVLIVFSALIVATLGKYKCYNGIRTIKRWNYIRQEFLIRYSMDGH